MGIFKKKPEPVSFSGKTSKELEDEAKAAGSGSLASKDNCPHTRSTPQGSRQVNSMTATIYKCDKCGQLFETYQ